jgi:hypothetical protein
MNSAIPASLSALTTPKKKKIIIKNKTKTAVAIVEEVQEVQPEPEPQEIPTVVPEEIPTPAPAPAILIMKKPEASIPTVKKISITIVPINTSTKKKTINTFEEIDNRMLDKLIASGKLKTEKWDTKRWGNMPPPFENELTQLREYRKKFKGSNNTTTVKYTLTSPTGFGRVYPFKSLSLGQFRRAVRHTLAKGIYADIDIKNCQPVLLQQICISNNINCPYLTQYVERRDTHIMPELMAFYDCEKDAVKNLFIRLIFFGSFNKWAEDWEIVDAVPTEFIIGFTNELMQVADIIVSTNPILVKLVNKHKDKDNITGSVVSLYCQEWERRILETIYAFMLENGILSSTDSVVLCFDGIMIPLSKFSNELLIQLKNVVYEKLNFNVDFVKKEMDEDFIDELNMQDNNDEIISIPENEEDIQIDQTKIYHMDLPYLDSLPSYTAKKKYFEIFITKIESPQCFAYNRARGDARSYDEHERPEMHSTSNTDVEIVKMFRNFYFTHEETKKSFISAWLGDSKIKCCKEINFLPYNGHQQRITKSQYYYNLFTGYSPYINIPFTNEETDKTLTQFMRIGRELCGGNQEHFEYVLHYFAHMIQKPAERIPICIVIKGNQGVGKNVWLNAIGNLLNNESYISTSNPEDIFGKYAEGAQHKLLVNLNECEGRDTFDLEGKIKSFITDPTLIINAKYQRPITINNYGRLIIFSNKGTPIPIDVKSGDRRYVVFQTTDEMLKIQHKDQYWSRAVESFKKPEFVARLYDYFNTLDINDYNFIKNRPITEAYREMCRMFVPTEALFFEDYIDSCNFEALTAEDDLFTKKVYDENVPMRLQCASYKKEHQVVGSLLYQDYTKWAKSKGFHREFAPSINSSTVRLPIYNYLLSNTRTANQD